MEEDTGGDLANIGSFAHLRFRSISYFGDITVYCHIGHIYSYIIYYIGQCNPTGPGP